MKNTISLEFKTPKENEHAIRWYIEAHVHNKTKYLCTHHDIKGKTIIMKWKGVKEEQCAEVIEALSELGQLYDLDIATTIEEEIKENVCRL